MFWDNIAWVYDIFADGINRKANRKLCKVVAGLISPTDNVLECACGTGLLSGVIAKRCKSLTATDFSAKMLARARKKYGQYPHVRFEQADILPGIVATATVFNGLDYRSISSVPTDEEKELKVVKEGAFIPETNIRMKENLVKLRKRGRALVASYEAVRYQRLDLFTVTLRQIGAYIARTLLGDAIDVLENGDGNGNAAPVVKCAENGALAYPDLISFWNGFDPYELNTVIASPDMMAAILNMTQFRDAAAGLSFHGTGKAVTPLGAKLLKSSAVGTGKLIGLDKSAALEMVKTGDVATEYDKLIDRQLERAVISCTAGFAKIFDGASKVLSV